MVETLSDEDVREAQRFRPRSDRAFFAGLAMLGGIYVVLVVSMLVANMAHTFFGSESVDMVTTKEFAEQHPVRGWLLNNPISSAFANEDIRYSIWLSLISCTITTILSLWVSVPLAYVMSRYQFRGKTFVDAVLDIPIVLPPLVIGLCLLMLFNYAPFRWVSSYFVFAIPGVILAQFMVACAFAVRTMRATFDQIPRRQEQVALTLGCSQGQAFWRVVLPQARRGMMAAGTLAWARSLGEFGPILIFAGATHGWTEVLSTTVFLEMQAGNLKAALAVSLIMITLAMIVLVIARTLGLKGAFQ